MDFSGPDPFDLAKREVSTSLRVAQDLHEEWRRAMLMGSDSGFNKLQQRFREEVERLVDDLDAMTDAVNAAATNPSRFNLSKQEIDSRRSYISDMRKSVSVLQQATTKAQPTAPPPSQKPKHVDFQSSNFGSTNSQQQALLSQQDEQLEELSRSAERLNRTAAAINSEIQDQHRMLVELDGGVDRQTTKMGKIMDTMSSVFKTRDRRQLCTILWLFLVALMLTILVVVV